MVARCPGTLAAMLDGRADVRLARYRPVSRLDLSSVGALVLWTKQPAPIVECGELADVLGRFARRGRIVLQLTVTGFGGSAVEPGIPAPGEVAAALGRVIDAGIVEPRAVKLRYDPVGTIRFPDAVHTNMRMDVFERVLELFVPMGIRAVTASTLDVVGYPRVAERISSVGGRVEVTGIEGFMRELAAGCASQGLVFSTCVNPPDDGLVAVEGCIDGRVINSWGGSSVWDAPHNAVGAQRKGCTCTYSLDIGHSPGVPMCSSSGACCLYCYASGAGLGAGTRRRVAELLESGSGGWTRV
jgi:hypothetical protein